MDRLSSNLLLTISLIAFCAVALGQSPGFTGRWRLNLDKSKLEHYPEGLTSSLFMIEQNGESVRLTRYHIFGDKQNKISFKMKADGKTRRIKVLFKGKLEKEETGLLATLWRKHFLNIVHYSFGASKDELIADETFTGKPQDHHNRWVFDRE